MRETKSPLTIQLSDDKTEAKIRATMLPMSAKDIEDAIGALAMARSQMQPPIPADYPQDHSAHRHQGTHYYVAWDFLGGCGEIGDQQETAEFLIRDINVQIFKGERRMLMLSNRAIDAYRRHRLAA